MEKALHLGLGGNDPDRSYKTRKEETGTEPGDAMKQFEELFAVLENKIAPVLETGNEQKERGWGGRKFEI